MRFSAGDWNQVLSEVYEEGQVAALWLPDMGTPKELLPRCPTAKGATTSQGDGATSLLWTPGGGK